MSIRRRTGSIDADGFPTSAAGTASDGSTRATASVVSNEAALAVIAANRAQSVRSTSDAGGRSVSSGDFGSGGREGGRASSDGTAGSQGRALPSSGGQLRSASSSETEQLAELLYSSDPMRSECCTLVCVHTSGATAEQLIGCPPETFQSLFAGLLHA